MPTEAEWVQLGVSDDVYYILRHNPCGTKVQIKGGYSMICPKCQPEEWAKEMGRHA